MLIALTFSILAGALRPDLGEIAATAVAAMQSETCGARLVARYGLAVPEGPLHVVYTAAPAGAPACRPRGTMAVTGVGSRVVYLCPSFARLDHSTARSILVHEWLHTLGLPESPADRRAPSSAEITAAVVETCR